MILGLGNDLVDIRRIELALERHGERFLQRVFTEQEIATYQSRHQGKISTLAKRFAAKEACAKALGTGFRDGLYLRDIEVTNLASGQPALYLHGNAKRVLETLTPKGQNAHLHLSMTDEYPYAQAVVIISVCGLIAI